MNEMRKWKRLFETRLKDGREVSLSHFEDFEDGLHCLEVYATLDGAMVGSGKYDMNTGEFRGIEVEPAFRRLGIASAIYDHVEQLGYDVKPSPYPQPDGIAFWTARQQRQQDLSETDGAVRQLPSSVADLEEWGSRIGVSATVFEHPGGSIELSEIHRHKGAPQGCGAEFILALCAYADRRQKRLFLTVTGGNEQSNGHGRMAPGITKRTGDRSVHHRSYPRSR